MVTTVTRIIDGDTFDVDPGWEWGDEDGVRVRIANFDAAEADEWGGKSATQKLKDLIEGEKIELKNAVDIDRGRVVCDVYYNGKDIKGQLN